jgi:hypothetical protein
VFIHNLRICDRSFAVLKGTSGRVATGEIV